MIYSGPHQADLSMVGPHSPVHLDILEDARHYASHVTQRVQQAHNYAAHLTHSALLSHDDAERQVVRIRNHQIDDPEMEDIPNDPSSFSSLENLVNMNETETTLNDRDFLNNLPSASEVLNALPNTGHSVSSGFSINTGAPSVTAPLMVSVPSPSLPYPAASLSTSALMVSLPSVSVASTMQGTSPTVTLTAVTLASTITSQATGSTCTVSTSSCLSAIPSPRPLQDEPSHTPTTLSQSLAVSLPHHTVARSHPRRQARNTPSCSAGSLAHRRPTSTQHSDRTPPMVQHSGSAAQETSLLSSLLRTQRRSSSVDSTSTHSTVSSRSSIPSVTVIPETRSTPASGAAASSSQRPSLLRCHLLAQQTNPSATGGRLALGESSQAGQAQSTEQDPASDELRPPETDANHNSISQAEGQRGVEAVGSSGPLGQTDVSSTSHLASVMGNELRSVLERVRSRQLDIQHTLSAFSQLQGPAEPSTSQEPNSNATVCAAPTSTGSPSSSVTSTTLPSSVSSISAEVDRRMETLNQLGHRVSEITQRSWERGRSHGHEGSRTQHEMRRHHQRRQQPYPSSHHRHRHPRRLQSILEMWRPYHRLAAAGAAEARPRDVQPHASHIGEHNARPEADRDSVNLLHRRHRQLRVEIEK